MTTDEAEFDVVVVGSGAAGMTAALTAAHHGLRRVVLEKTGYFGGSTARSGGGIWAPGNEVLRQAGVRDAPEQARAYLAHVAGRRVPAASAAGAARARPGHARFRPRASTPVEFAWVPGLRRLLSRGARRAGRRGAASSRCRWTAGCSGAELAHLNPPYLPAPKGVTITQADYRWLSLGTRHPRAHARRRAGRRAGGARPAAPAAHAQHGPGPGRGPAGGAGGAAGAGLARARP